MFFDYFFLKIKIILIDCYLNVIFVNYVFEFEQTYNHIFKACIKKPHRCKKHKARTLNQIN